MNAGLRFVQTVRPTTFRLDETGVLVTSPRLSVGLRASETAVRLLMLARTPLAAGSPPDGWGLTDESWRAVLDGLISAGFLLDVSDGSTDTPNLPFPWRVWGTEAWELHVRARNVKYLVDEAAIIERKSQLTAAAEPRAFTPAPADEGVLLLPRIRRPLARTFEDVLLSRRTQREFADQALSLDTFSSLLHYCFAPQRFADCGDLGVVQLRTSASAGSRHEIDAYLVVMNVHGISPGVFRYDGLRHGLIPVSTRAGRTEWEDLTYGQGFFTNSCFAVVLVTHSERMAWKYRTARAYRLTMQNVGHLAQVTAMVAEALSLGAALTGAFDDDAVEELLGLDTPAEFATFVLAVGHPLAKVQQYSEGDSLAPNPWVP